MNLGLKFMNFWAFWGRGVNFGVNFCVNLTQKFTKNYQIHAPKVAQIQPKKRGKKALNDKI